jgi:hypothetical protein
MFKKGDNIKVKKGIQIPDLEEFDMTDWQGRVVGFIESEEVKGEYLLDVEWDSLTIKGLSQDYIKKTIENEFDFDTMVLDKTEVEKTIARDKPHERTSIIEAIKNSLKYKNRPSESGEIEIDEDEDDYEDDFDGVDEDEDTYFAILGSKKISTTTNNVKRYYLYIKENMTLPCMLTGIESMGYDFGWEEKYDFGYGSKKDRDAIRKNRASYHDTFEFLEFIPKEIDEYETIPVRVRRIDDNKIFILRLDELQASDEESSNYQLLDDFSCWKVNY